MIQVGDSAISLDRLERGANMDFISHAHTDHIYAARRSVCVIASEQTIDLMKSAYGINAKAAGREHTEKISARLFNAGHMMGAKQLAVTSPEGECIVYSGDFQMQKSRVAEAIEIPQADTLIIDSTYPNPKTRFDDRCETEVAIQKWTSAKLDRGIILFGAYAMGKAQELIAILNEAGIAPLVTKKIAAISETYRKNGYDLDYIPTDGDFTSQSYPSGTFVGITEKPLRETAATVSASKGIRVFTGVATGFAKSFRFDTDVQFPLSDHADFAQSLEYIIATGARKVFTYGKGAEAFAAHLSIAGFDAVPFGSNLGNSESSKTAGTRTRETITRC